MAGPIRIAILGNSTSAVGAIRRTGAATTTLGTRFKAATLAAAKFAAAGAALGAGLAAYGAVKFAQAAAEDQQAAALMAKAFRNAAGATDAQIAATEKWISAQGVALGVTDDQLRPALSKLVTATGDVGKAQQLASLAMDVSAGTGKDLQTVSLALAKAQNGSVSGLSRLGIATKTASGETMTLSQVTQSLADKFGGAAKTKANTFQGQLDRLKLIASEAGESLGAKLLPVLTDFASWLIDQGIPAASRFGSMLAEKFGPPLRTAGAFVVELVQRISGFIQSLRDGQAASSPVMAVVTRIGSVFAQVAGVIQTQVLPIIAALARFYVSQLLPVVLRIAQTVGQNLKPVFDQLAATFQGKVLPGVSRLLAKFEEYRPTLQRVALLVVRVAGVMLDLSTKVLGKVLPVLIRLAAFIVGGLISALVRFIADAVRGGVAIFNFGQKVVAAGQDVARFAQKVGQKIGEAIGFVRDLPTKAKSALAGIGTALLQAGRDLVQGFIDGIVEKFGAVKAKLDELTGMLPDWKGPPKRDRLLLRQAGRDVLAGLVDGFDDGSEGVRASLEKLTGFIEKTFTKRLADIKQRLDKTLDGKALDKALAKAEKRLDKQQAKILKGLRDQKAALLAAGKAQDKANEALAAARDALAALQDQAASYAEGIKQSFIDFGNVVGLGEGNGYSDAAQMVELLRAKVEQAKQYAAMIKALQAAGLNSTAIQQLIDAGVEGGLGTAQAILAGGPEAVAQINALQAELAAVGADLGTSTAQTMYGAGIQAAQGLVDGLAANAEALAKQATKLAKALVKAVEKALGIESPSRVFRDLGKQTVRGLGIGLDDVYVRRQGQGLATSLEKGFGSPALTALMDARLSTAQRISLDLTLSAQQVDQLSRGRAIQQDLDAWNGVGGRAKAS